MVMVSWCQRRRGVVEVGREGGRGEVEQIGRIMNSHFILTS
jgi:hypothetical protein